MGAHQIRFVEADIAQAFALYQELSGRSVILSPTVPMTTKITFDNATPLTRVEALQALDNVLAAHSVVMVYLGTKYVKAVSPREAASEPGPIVELPPDRLPDSSSFLIYVVKLRKLTPEAALPIVMPFARLPNSIMASKGSDVLILRDYSANVRRMVQVLEEIEAGTRSENPVRRLLHSLGETNSKPQTPNPK